MKQERHSKVIELINKYDIETQEDLAEKLSECGIPSTQATISRDIKQLKIVKVQTANGRYKYAPSGFDGEIKDKKDKNDAKFHNILKETVVKVDTAQNLVVVKTYSGMAQAAAEVIDTLELSEIVGTIAGDNTIFMACATEENAGVVAAKLRKIIIINS